MLTIRFLLSLTAFLAVFLTLQFSTASAQEPQRLTDRVTDEAGVLDGDSLDPVLDAFEEATGAQFFALFVETTGSTPLTDYVDDTIALNNFGVADALFVVAVEDRTYQLWVGERLADEVSVDEQDDVLIDDVEPFLADGDYDGAVQSLASGLALAATGEQLPLTPVATPTGNGDASGNTGGGGPNIFVVMAVLAAIGAAIWGFFKLFRRFRPASGDGAAAAPAANLAERANEVLLDADEAVRDASQEIAFAEAEFGAPAVADARKSLAEAEGKLNEAFRLRQQLDDDEKESATERDAMLRALIAAAEAAIEIAEEEGERADALRDMEQRAGELVAALPDRIAAVNASVGRAEGDFAFLQANARGVIDDVEGNVVEAEKCVDFANEQMEAAGDAVAAGASEPSAPAIRAAQAALAEADRLANAVTELRTRVEEARAALPADLRAAESSITAAKGGGEIPQTASDSLREAERLLAEARDLAAGANADPVSARARAVEARAAAESAGAAVRSEQERQQQLASTAASALASARSAVDRAEDYIQGRRMGVGSSARTRVAEAKRYLSEARSAERTDPQQSASLAGRAAKLAEEALRLASRDFASYDQPVGRRPSTLPGARHGSRGSDLASAGGVLAEILGAGVDGSRWGAPRKPAASRSRSSGGRSSAGGFSIPGVSRPGRSSSKSSAPRSSGGRSRGGRW